LSRPELKQFRELLPEDFDRHPAWISCHTADYGAAWYVETDEETFRPWTGALPVSPSEGMLLVRATIELRDGSRYGGFVTPAFKERDLGALQPHIFVGNSSYRFWGGMFGVKTEEREAFYAALRKPPEAIFPLQFSADAALATGVTAGQVTGFYRGSRDVQVGY
jgi:hypothetical protein